MTGRKSFKKEVIDFVFMHTTKPKSGSNQKQVRQDRKGTPIARAAYGNRKSKMGWDIHHIDGNKNNNNKNNLEALHHDNHDAIHNG